MVRFVTLVAAAGASVLAACGSARAAPEITLAAIATGRLYIVGTTEKPHMPVVLESKFRTESDDKGKFQYELVYHPARCIVSASIDGKAVEAVVSNCSEQCPVVPQAAVTGASGLGAAASPPAVPRPQAGPVLPRARQPNRAAIAAPPARTGADAVADPPTAAPAAAPRRIQIERPPRPPQRPAVRPPVPQAKAIQPAKPARKPRPAPREAPDDAGPPIAD